MPIREPETHLILEAPGGLVLVKAVCKGQKVMSVETHNLPSFVDRLMQHWKLKDMGRFKWTPPMEEIVL